MFVILYNIFLEILNALYYYKKLLRKSKSFKFQNS